MKAAIRLKRSEDRDAYDRRADIADVLGACSFPAAAAYTTDRKGTRRASARGRLARLFRKSRRQIAERPTHQMPNWIRGFTAKYEFIAELSIPTQRSSTRSEPLQAAALSPDLECGADQCGIENDTRFVPLVFRMDHLAFGNRPFQLVLRMQRVRLALGHHGPEFVVGLE